MKRKFHFVKHPVRKAKIARSLEKLYRRIIQDPFGADMETLRSQQPALFRAVKKMQAMYKRAKNPCHSKKPVLIYDKVEFIGATKGEGSHFAGKKFIHRFKRPARMYGNPDGSITIR